METYERIKELRKDILNINQENFSKRINISRSNLGNIETGKIKLTERVINDICREFYVNKNWIYTGIGNPILTDEKEKDLMDILKNELNLDDDKCEIIQQFLSLTERQQNAIIELVHSFLPEKDLHKIQKEVEKKSQKLTNIIKVPARGSKTGYFEIEMTEETQKGFEDDLNYDDSEDENLY